MFDGAALATAADVGSQTDQQADIARADSGSDPSATTDATDGQDALLQALTGYPPPTAERQEIVFVDPAVNDLQTLLNGIAPTAEVILLDANQDGIAQIAETLANRTGIDAIHLIAEGNDAQLHLGTSFLTQDSLSSAYAEQLQRIGQSLSANADLLIYGCNFGHGADGQLAMSTLAALTGADVAASTDRTGSATEYGDWILEVSTGTIEAAIVIGEATQAQWDHALATYTVTNTNDSGAGSLRQAILDANAAAGTDTIVFNIGAPLVNGAHTISLASELPQVTDATVIDGRTEPDYSGAPVVVIDMNGLNGAVLSIAASNSEVHGLALLRAANRGLLISSGASNVIVTGNYFGVAADGITAPGTGAWGVDTINAGSGIVIGGTTTAERNIFGGNSPNGGLAINNTLGVTVIGNYFGVGADGTTVLANSRGIALYNNTTGTRIGGTGAGEGNLIVGNSGAGISIVHAASKIAILGNSIYGNGGQGIDLWADNAVLVNDAMDVDTGANDGQNYPVLSLAHTNASSQVTVAGSLNSLANDFYRIEFFVNPMQDASGYGEGKTYLGFVNVATDGSGNASFNTTLTANVPAGYYLSATATRATDNTYSAFTVTSEFAQNVVTLSTAPTIANLNGDSLAYSEGDGAVVIEQGGNATVTDVDSADFNTGTLTVTFTAGSDSTEDILAIRNQGTGAGQIGVSGSNVTYGGVTIGTFTGGSVGSALVITFNSNATPTAATALVRNITYQNTDAHAPTTGGRTVRFVLTDGDGETSANYDTTVTVTPVNDAPTDIVFDSESTPESIVNTYVTGDQNQPAIAALSNGGYVVVWVSNGQDGSGAGIYGQRFDETGARVGAEFLVTGEVADDETGPSVSTFADGGFVVAWQDQISGVRAWTEARVFNSDGTAATAEFAVSPGTDGNNEGYQPAVQTLDANRFVIIWGNEIGGSTYEIAGRIYDRSGALQGSQFTVGSLQSSTALFGAQAEVTLLNDGGFAATWRAYNGTAFESHLCIMNSDGTGRSADIALGGDHRADVSGLRNGNLVAVYGSGTNISARIFNSAGTEIVPAFAVNTSTAGTQIEPTVTRSDDGFVVIWQSDVGDGSGTDIYAQRLDANGYRIGTEVLVNTTTAGTQAFPEAIETRSGQVRVVWESENVDGDGYAVVSRVMATSNATVSESASNGTRVADVLGVFDVDNGDTATYSLTNNAGGRFAINSTTGVITVANASLLDYETSTSHTITVRVTDSGGLTYDEVLTISVLDANDAPVLADTALSLTVVEDAGVPNGAVGSLVSAFTGGITDVDSGAVKGLAITGSNETNGTWYYTTNGGTTWTAVGTVSDSAARLLANDANTRLYFAPAANYTGTSAAALTLRAWDQTSGTAGTTADTTTTGGLTAFSTATDTVDVTVTPVNDAPTFLVGGGMVTTAFGTDADEGRSVLVQPDGKIVVVGMSKIGSSFDFAIARYNTDGSLDTSFGGGDGKVTTPLILSSSDVAYSVALQADGKILVAGEIYQGTSSDFALVRYNADGSLDTTFGGGDGIVTTPIGVGSEDGNSVAIQSDGKILVAGFSNNGTDDDFAVVRYNTDGSLDTSFGGGDGIVTTPIGLGEDQASSTHILSDGKILVAGTTFSTSGGNFDFALVQYNADGSLDSSFGGGDGIVVTDVAGGNDRALSMAVQTDGKILLGGYAAVAGSWDFAVIRYNVDGTLDTSYSGDGIASAALGAFDDRGTSLVLQADGKAIIAGHVFNGTNYDLGLARFNTDGTLDTSFGGGAGTVTMPVGAGNDYAYAVAVQADGKILVSGSTDNGSNNDLLLVRFNSDGSLDTTFGVQTTTLDGTPTFTEGGAPVVLDIDVDISDSELDMLNGGAGNYDGASLTIVRNGGASSDDVLSFTDGNGITLVGNNLIKNTQIIATFDTATTPGQLLVTFTDANGEIPTSSDVDTILRQIAYANSSDAPPASIQFNWTFDDGNTGSQGTGGALQATGSTVVTIIPVNDAPSALGNILTVFEDGHYVFQASDFNFSDIDGDSFAALVISTVPTNGTLYIDANSDNVVDPGEEVAANDVVLVSTITSNLFKYHPDANVNGIGADSFTFQVRDDGGTANGGVDTDPTPDTITFNITPVNDAPVITSSNTASVTENTTSVLTVTSTDIDGGTPTYSIVPVGSGGAADGALLTINAATGALSFLTAPDYETPTDADLNNEYQVTVQIADGNGGTATQVIMVTVTDIVNTPTVTTAADNNDSGIVEGNATHTIEWLNAHMGTDGLVSLREAIIASNNTAGTDTIAFGIAGTGIHTINVGSALPTISEAVILDATTDDSFATNSSRPAIVLDGNDLAADGLVLSSTADGSTIRGFVIRDFGGDGIQIDVGSDGNTIAGNYIGRLTPDGSDAGAGEENAGSGILVQGANTVIGGTTAADRNVITGNLIAGVYVDTTSGTLIEGNYIGLDGSGTAAIGQGNLNDGIWLDNATNTTVGGTAPGARNVISGNSYPSNLDDGLYISGGADNTVQGNYFGSDASGTIAIGNYNGAISIEDSDSNLIGGTTIGAGNLFMGNGNHGVRVDSLSIANSILGNTFINNGGLGIDLAPNGVTANDAGDGDTGANNLQNFPILTSAITDATQITIAGTLNSLATDYFRIEFYASGSADPSGYGEGERYLGFVDVTTDASGDASFSTTLTATVNAGEFVTATATRSDAGFTAHSDTSEFSAQVTATVANASPVNTVPGAQTVAEDTALALTGLSVTDVDGNLSTVQLDVTQGTLTVTLSGATSISAGSNGSSSLTLAGSEADLNATLASLLYQGTLNYTGPDTLTVTSTDATSATDVDTVAITVTPVNSAPYIFTNSGSTALEGGVDPITNTELLVLDTDNTPAELRYSVTGTPGNGYLERSTAPGLAIAAFSQADLDAGLIRYVHNGSETTSDSFTFTVQDGNGGNLGPTTFSITVTPTNDAPVNFVPGAQTLPGEAPLVFSLANGTQLAISDADAGSNLLQITLTSPDGTMTLNGTAGLVFSVGDGDTDQTMTFTGTVASLNAALDGLQFTTTTGFNGTTTLNLTTNDLGNTGVGGPQQVTSAVPITIGTMPLVIPPPTVTPPPTTSEPLDTANNEMLESLPGAKASLPPSRIGNSQSTAPPPSAGPQPETLGGPAEESPHSSIAAREQDPRTVTPRDTWIPTMVLDWADRLMEQLPPITSPELLAKIPVGISNALKIQLAEIRASLEAQSDEDVVDRQFRAQVTAGSGVALSAGFITWLLRSGSLLASLLASMPAWRYFDPIPVLQLDREQRKGRDQVARAAAAAEYHEFKGLEDLLEGHDEDDKPEQNIQSP